MTCVRSLITSTYTDSASVFRVETLRCVLLYLRVLPAVLSPGAVLSDRFGHEKPKVFCSSRSATWSGPVRQLTEEQALWEVVQWAWQMHAEHYHLSKHERMHRSQTEVSTDRLRRC